MADDSGVDATSASDAAPPSSADAAVPSGDDAGADATLAADASDSGADAGDSTPSDAAPLAAYCGNGQRDPSEECDPGAGYAPPSCSYSCGALDFLPLPAVTTDAAPLAARSLAAARHPIAAATDGAFAISFAETSALSLATFDSGGRPLGTPISLASGARVSTRAEASAAGIGAHRWVAAWSDGAIDGDELGIALQIVDGTAPVGATIAANTTSTGSQRGADVIVVGGQIVVAWVDDSNPTTAPDIKVRTFSSTLAPIDGESAVAATLDAEDGVALAPFAGGYAVAWRSLSAGAESIHVRANGREWTLSLAAPAPAGDRPAIAALDATRVLLAYSDGIDADGDGVVESAKVRVAVLDTTSVGPAAATDVTPLSSPAVAAQDAPSAAVVGGRAYVAWHTATAAADVSGEETWVKELVQASGGALDFTKAEVPLPRSDASRAGDQRNPTLASDEAGARVITAWDDLGRALGGAERDGDVVATVTPSPLLRITNDRAPVADLQRFADRERALYCQRFADCCLIPQQFDYAKCEALPAWGGLSAAKAYVDGGNVTLSRAQADRCLRESVGVDCRALTGEGYGEWQQVCARALVGAIPVGQSGCRAAVECAGDAYCELPSDGGLGTCAALKASGATCASDVECAYHAVLPGAAYCATGAGAAACAGTKPVGAACVATNECASGFCMTTPQGKVCVESVPMTDPGVDGGVCSRMVKSGGANGQ